MNNNIKNGIGCSNGIATAESYLLIKPKYNIDDKKNIITLKSAKQLLKSSIAKTIEQLKQIEKITNDKLGSEKAAIFVAHQQIANDPEIIKEIESNLNTNKVNLIKIIDTIFNKYHDMFINMEDNYFKERAIDVIDVKLRLIANVLNLSIPNLLSINAPCILICHELTPSDTALLSKKYVLGIVAEVGGRTSHAAIMARSLEIPCVLGVKDIIKNIKKNQIIAIDGSNGIVDLKPNIKVWKQKDKNYQKQQEELNKYIKAKTITKDKINLTIEANIGNPADASGAIKYGAEGVGLYRTEFLYMGNDHWPTEEEQFQGYKAVLEQMPNNLVVIRTLDIGGDKKLSYHTFEPEMNPFLGNRAIRFCLNQLKIFKTQIRALVRASAYGKLAIMFPMIATIDEFKQARKLVEDVIKEVKTKKIKVGKIQIGMMVEIPSSAILSEQFAKYADFFSIGTNDLIQYTFACDRMSKSVAYLYQPNNPALLNMINLTIKGGHKYKKWVGMCGEMAGDILSIPLLMGMGLDSYSMSATSIPRARQIISSLTINETKKLVQKALQLDTTSEVNKLVQNFLKTKKLI